MGVTLKHIDTIRSYVEQGSTFTHSTQWLLLCTSRLTPDTPLQRFPAKETPIILHFISDYD